MPVLHKARVLPVAVERVGDQVAAQRPAQPLADEAHRLGRLTQREQPGVELRAVQLRVGGVEGLGRLRLGPRSVGEALSKARPTRVSSRPA